MSTTYEFKKLSEVEVLETASDEAHVLVEEGGVVRRVPKTEVGGAGGSGIEYDAIIDHSDYSTPVLTQGSYSDLWTKVTSGEIVNVLVMMVSSGSSDEYFEYNPVRVSAYSYSEAPVYVDCVENSLHNSKILFYTYSIESDGTVSVTRKQMTGLSN